MNDKFYALPEEKQSQILNAAYKVFATNQYKRHQPQKLQQKPEYPSHFCFIIFIINWSYIFFYGSMQQI